MTNVTIVGGGITGLAAAWELARAGAHVTIVEATDRLGGRIQAEQLRGRTVDLGPDAFLARVPDAMDLCAELGLGDELVGAVTGAASVWVGGRLRPLPAETVLGAPTDLRALARSGVVSPLGAARAALDLVLPRRDLGPDPTVGDIICSRFGRDVHERLVDPLVGGIHAGPSSRLSAAAVAPQLAQAARSHRSLLLGLRRAARAAPRRAGPAFVSLPGGLTLLVTRLEEALRSEGVEIHLGRVLTRVPAPGADVTIATTPAAVTASLVAHASPGAAAELAAMESASVALTLMIYPISAFPAAGGPPGRAGFLVPQRERRLMTACSFGSAKWPHWAAASEVVLRVSAGRWGDRRAMEMDDAALVSRLHTELCAALGLVGEPLETRVQRWPDSFPQYRPGHFDRVARIEAALARDLPGVLVAGAAYRGVGIPACIAQGRAAGRAALER